LVRATLPVTSLTVAWAVQLSTMSAPLIQSRMPAFERVWNWKLPETGASTKPVQRTEKLFSPMPGPGEALQVKFTFSTRSRAGAPDSVVLLKYSAWRPVPVFGVPVPGAASWFPIWET